MCLLIKYHLPMVQNNKLYVCRPEVTEQVALSQDLVLQAMRLLYLLVRKTRKDQQCVICTAGCRIV